MKKLFTLLSASVIALTSMAQEKKDTAFRVKFSGFVNSQAMFDTRQNANARETMLILYPLNVSKDREGKDVNAHPSLNQLSMISRIALTATGPDVLGAKVMGLLESDFSGPSNVENNALRLRHAYVKMNWSKQELLVGQYWHPLNVPEMLPNLLSLSTGAPFHPFSRNVQVRASQTFGSFKAVLFAGSQRDFVSYGPNSTSSEYMRNAVTPNFDAQIQFKKGIVFAGVGVDYKELMPRIKTDSNYNTKSKISSLAATAFAKVEFKKFDVRAQAVWGQNLSDQTMMGGYAVKSINPVTQEMKYTNISQLSFWGQVGTRNAAFNASLFGGYMKSLGAEHDVVGKTYGRDASIAYIYRVTPIFSYTKNNLKFAAEFEYTVAGYGAKVDNKYNPKDVKEVNNLRSLLVIQYNF